jgi:Zn finger protein HypA/HybF involved in hydrogenase expression
MSHEGDTSAEFTCSCGKFKNWMTEGKVTSACPGCGRRYVGIHDYDQCTLVAVEWTEPKETP